MNVTPGPWRVFSESLGDGLLLVDVVTTAIISNNQALTICELTNGDKLTDLTNARLIAAAPDLLTALIKLTNESAGFLAMSDPCTHGRTNRAVLRERIRLAQDAIAKAEGTLATAGSTAGSPEADVDVKR